MDQVNDLDDTKRRIIEAAGQVFGQKGFEGGTIREICQLAGANVAAVNYHFGDKQKLYVETVRAAHLWRAEQSPLPEWTSDTPATVKLRDFIETTLTRMLNEGGASWHVQVMLREISRPSGACQELVHDYIRPHFGVLNSILLELLPPGVGDAERRRIGFSVIGQCLFYRVAQPVLQMLAPPAETKSQTPAQLAEHIASFTLAALGIVPAICGTHASSRQLAATGKERS
jgi:AcrR family transcriptional regulator